MRYGYARTNNGQDIKTQIRALNDANVDMIFSDENKGTRQERAGYNKLMSLISKGDTIVVTEPHRLTRDSIAFAKLSKNGIHLTALN
ncbi:MAG: recombinase family protein [Ruminococcus sp.]|nr:recombinase family protein [Ruminococcus sp.]